VSRLRAGASLQALVRETLQNLQAPGARRSRKPSARCPVVRANGTAERPGPILILSQHVELFSSGSSNRRLAALTERELSVLGLMAQGLSNQAIGRRLFLSESAISKYTTSLFGKLGIADNDNSNRRVLAVLSYLNKP
jgi:DNA-binding NarL/FixJ family response regulator